MVVEVVLDGGIVHLGSQRQGIHQVLAHSLVAVALLVEHLANVAAHTLEQAADRLQGAGQPVDIRHDGRLPGLGLGGGRDGAQRGALGVGEEQTVGYLDEKAALGGAVDVDGHGGR